MIGAGNPLIEATGLILDLPVLSMRAKSLRHTVLRVSTGGKLMRDNADHVVVRALDGVSFTLREGERLGLVGHNGSGKSTLLRTLAGVYRPTGGHLAIRGRRSPALDPMVGIDMEASGRENIITLARYRGIDGREARRLAPEIAAFTELGAFLDMPVKTYSMGMVTRLAFAVATSFEPDILLMDEWIAAADSRFVDRARERMESLFSKARAVVLATHDRDLIQRLCTRTIELSEGRIIRDEPVVSKVLAVA